LNLKNIQNWNCSILINVKIRKFSFFNKMKTGKKIKKKIKEKAEKPERKTTKPIGKRKKGRTNNNQRKTTKPGGKPTKPGTSKTGYTSRSWAGVARTGRTQCAPH
jgi:hypothetical protein